MATIGNLMVNVGARVGGLKSGLNKAQGLVSGATSKLRGLGAAAGKLALGGLVAGTVALGAMGGMAVNVGGQLLALGSDAEEMQAKFDTVFGELGPGVQLMLDGFAGAVGRNKFELRGYAAELQDTLVPMGLAGDAAADMSVDLVKLGTDLSSFNNMPMDEAMRRLQGTLIGSHENALAFGVVINENTLKAELAKNGWDQLSGAQLEAAKVQARYNLLMEGTTAAQGDAARTAGSWANQSRALRASISEAATAAGLELLPVVTPLLSNLGSLVREILPPMVERFREFAGDLSGTLGPAMVLIEDAWNRIVVAFGGSPEDITAAGVAVGALGAILDGVVTVVQGFALAMQGVAWAVEKVNEAIQIGKGLWDQYTTIFEKLHGVELPAWLKPGSPPPLENALRGITAAQRDLNELGGVNVPVSGGPGNRQLNGQAAPKFSLFSTIELDGQTVGRALGTRLGQDSAGLAAVGGFNRF